MYVPMCVCVQKDVLMCLLEEYSRRNSSLFKIRKLLWDPRGCKRNMVEEDDG